MALPADRPPTVHPAVIGSRCKKCGGPLVSGRLYVIVKQSGKTGTKQDSVCLVCIGQLLLTSDEFVEALAERLLQVMDKAQPPEGLSSGG